MPKGIYKRVKPPWNKEINGYSLPSHTEEMKENQRKAQAKRFKENPVSEISKVRMSISHSKYLNEHPEKNPWFGGNKGKDNPNYKDGLGACRGYADHKISFEHPGCVWHHVNMMFVVACPEEIHKKCNHHILGTGKSVGIHGHYLEGVLG